MPRVLIADSDPASQVLLAQALVADNCQTELVTQGKEVLRRIGQEEVDAIITEVHLPDMPAWQLIPQVRQVDPDLPIIAVTADDSWETSRQVRVEGGPVFFYGLKPLDLQEMRRVVDCALRWRQKRRHGRPLPRERRMDKDICREF